MTNLTVHQTKKYGKYVVRKRREVKTIEMSFDEFERLAFLRPYTKNGKLLFEETEI